MTAQALDFNPSTELRRDFKQWRSRALAAGAVGLLLTVAGVFLVSPNQFYRSYLWSYVFYLGVSLGCLAWLMLQYLTGGAWGVVIRRPAEAAARTLPLLAVLFIPIVVGIPNLYRWSHADAVAADEILQHKQTYLNVPFFLIRAAAYFIGWNFLGWYLNRWSAVEDSEGGMRPHKKMAFISGPGLVFWGFSITFMAVDWVLSLDPHWFSTMFGLLFMAGQGLSSMAFLVTLLVLLFHRRPMSEILTARHLHDLGKFLLMMVMVWAYFAFSQFLIIWAGNLPDEIPWYLERLSGGWQYIGLLLVLGHFALPFALLLSRDLKRNFKFLASLAVFILLMRYVDLFWLVAPDFAKGGFHMSWMDITAPIGIGGIWLAYFLAQLEKRPLLPVNEPHLVEALEHGRE
ncbi:MAG TPA: hypothetical protein VKB88_25670 [Bryobacteraceae bacterium]|nr:hypothetical protein [Bryobacteraceae bacterium]